MISEPIPTAQPARQMANRFDPYEDNGGTTMALAGEDFCIVAADTRQSDGYHINCRYAPKAHQLSDKTVIGTSGFYADGICLVKRIKQRMEWYYHQHDKVMSTPALAQLLSVMLYQKRFFPYYCFTILGGLDEEGKGCVFDYDSVGNVERVKYQAEGSGKELLQPFLDSQIGLKNRATDDVLDLTEEKAIKIVKDAFSSVTERDIHTGDCVEIYIIRKDGIECEKYPLKRD
ncbi:N-terminal nucleophile aminohydrolase [Anaeromyces robustus]|uniref:Proteasome subunit beta n=1 Tax=Anaeromyces robustus TaxID=1754192 RepID=A0A1Y1XN09_9FUNG|nr:N-terminal nucleophile aminohydrolase [Anaeromyces robustus]|eukprot:ORX86734.1 N-terminal nucleophile aminohydrolase [Anaeromyces robustus]